jgi:hypothetical protein
MNETSAARGPNWLGFSIAALVLLFVCVAALIGDMLAGGRTSAPMVTMAAGYAAVAALVERKWRGKGIAMLVLSPFVYMAALALLGLLRGAP